MSSATEGVKPDVRELGVSVLGNRNRRVAAGAKIGKQTRDTGTWVRVRVGGVRARGRLLRLCNTNVAWGVHLAWLGYSAEESHLPGRLKTKERRYHLGGEYGSRRRTTWRRVVEPWKT